MKKIHFVAANGFPARTYEYLFSKMGFADIDFINIIGHKPSNNKANYGFLKDELIEHLDANINEPVIGIGHSAGGATLMLAASERPELFEKIILIDPPLFSARKRFVIGVARALGLWQHFGPVKKATNRRSKFSNKEEAFNYWEGKALFRQFHKECFSSYVEHGLVECDDGVELNFKASVEADIFRNLVVNFPKKMSQIQATLIFAEKGNLLWESDIAWWKKKHPNFDLVGFDGHHLFPFEQPDKTVNLLKHLVMGDNTD
ncbi:MAG: pimeloyl-ACP methyl ester carboxylesterase [Polaribacter sp.]|jgi:pimeloyl-ACP methyl ester carboxylesterase